VHELAKRSLGEVERSAPMITYQLSEDNLIALIQNIATRSPNYHLLNPMVRPEDFATETIRPKLREMLVDSVVVAEQSIPVAGSI
jgi:hypothetical protein